MGKKRSKMYNVNHRILLVGEGDFSFSLCLARRFGSAVNMVATSLDSRGNVIRKYTNAWENLQELEDLGCSVLHGIDVHTMSRRAFSLQGEEFDRIVFNFPHAGFHHPESSTRQIELHQHLIRGFLENAIQILAAGGQVFITHKIGYPYDQWEIGALAEEVGLYELPEVPFYLDDYPGYVNKKGNGPNCNKTFPVGDCSTFRFSYE